MDVPLTSKVGDDMNARNELEPCHRKKHGLPFQPMGTNASTATPSSWASRFLTIVSAAHNEQCNTGRELYKYMFCGWNPDAELPYGRPIADRDHRFLFPPGHVLGPPIPEECDETSSSGDHDPGVASSTADHAPLPS